MMKKAFQALLVLGVMLSGLVCTVPAMGRIYYIHNDHLGTPRALTDQNQNVLWRADTAPYGRAAATGTVTFNLRFPGQYHDEETGLHYNWNRYYDPRTGRYLTPDPIGLAGGLNPYLYGAANPLRYVDPWGLDFRSVNGQRMTIIRGQRPPPGNSTDDPLNPISVGITALGLVPEAGGGILKGSSVLRAGACGVATKRLPASSATNRNALSKQLASEQQMGEAGTIMAGRGGRVPFRDAGRVAKEHGGNASYWVKKTSSSHTSPDGTRFETHWVENLKTGQRVEFKTKFPGR